MNPDEDPEGRPPEAAPERAPEPRAEELAPTEPPREIGAAAPEPIAEPEPARAPQLVVRQETPPLDADVFGVAPEPSPQIVTASSQEGAAYVEDHAHAYEPAYEPAPESAHDDVRYAPQGDLAPFGEPEIPMPAPTRRGDRQRARDARRNLDLDLGRIKRRKRYGLVITTISVLFVALVLAPVTWAGVYLFIDPPATILMMQRAAEGQTIRHYPVPLNRMSPHVVRAVIAAEDASFCTHDGFDVDAIQNAVQSNARGRRMRGGSTVSQQTAKNLFLWPERSWVRKGFETYFTALIEFMWPKRRIMEAYLNAAEWGDGNFGVEAAARARFGVAAADLSPLQAARLAAVLPSPNRWRADSPGPYVRRRAASIVERARVVRNEHMSGCVLALDRAS